jgi:peptidoglycan hydrolase CwlO-like protein
MFMQGNDNETPSPLSRFTAMSKLIGIFIAIFLAVIIIYTMYEMHMQHDLSSLPQLIISIFGIGGIYVGFYLTMAKWEHIEAEKTTRQQDLLKLKKELGIYDQNIQLAEDIEECEQDIAELNAKIEEIQSQEFTSNNY